MSDNNTRVNDSHEKTLLHLPIGTQGTGINYQIHMDKHNRRVATQIMDTKNRPEQ